ncbi:hypothetical protein QOZ96_002396 [Brevundimonas nasdae]|uniref:hypothetical protein n=1 Tax=Brevundimonas nasdae TaxID=172043 RepID=UPI001912019D|nr:hypothetical protein [Brevundimonas nasdae]MBK6025709.1 hypothetical protein [Brevundimonas nasdae]MDQ0452443.1 hypothetical protein [Brevundimonas nasdae]
MIALLALVAAMQAGNEPQWVTGRIQDRDPVASFLSWDFSSVILRATCRNHEVAIDYYGDDVVPRDAPKTTLFVDGDAFEMRRTGVAEYVIDEAGVAALQRGQWVEFDAPNEMDEPWHLGEAHALKTLAATCLGNGK